jgi:hypothetical protein
MNTLAEHRQFLFWGCFVAFAMQSAGLVGLLISDYKMPWAVLSITGFLLWLHERLKLVELRLARTIDIEECEKSKVAP